MNTRTLKRSFLATLLSSSIMATPALAQSVQTTADEDNPQVEDTVTVTGRTLYTDRVNALKTPTPIIDVPQSLSITSAEQIIQQGFDSIGDIVLYTPGITQSQGEGHRLSLIHI